MLARVRALPFRALRPVALVLALTAMSVYLVLGVVHVRYPFELEWMEGGLVDEILRVASGKPIYVQPTLDFVPFLYAPLYVYVAAAFTKVFGAGFFAPRLVSYLASIGAIALIVRFVHRETAGDRFAAILAGGLFAATYCQSSAFFDLARVDSLFVLLALAALYVVRFVPSPRGRVAAAALFTLAFLTKQSASFLIVPVALHVALTDRKKAWIFVGSCLALLLGSVLVLDAIHGGWFSYFVLWLPRQHPLVERMAYDFWIADLMAPLGVAMLAGLFYLLIGAEDAEARRFHALATAGLLAVSWTGRLHAGGWPNVIMPGFAALAILFGLGVHTALSLARRAPEERRRGAEAMVLLAAIVQLGCLAYNPGRFLPSARDRAAGYALVASIRAIDGDVFVPAHGYLNALAGKPSHAHEMALEDILGIGGGKPGAVLLAELREAIRSKRFAAIVPDTDWHRREIELSYRRTGDAVSDPLAFYPVTGMRTRPRGMYLPR